MRFAKGTKIRVRPSKSLGTPATLATIIKVDRPIGHKDYPQGLALVQGNEGPDDQYHVDSLGYVYSGPPLNGLLVRFS